MEILDNNIEPEEIVTQPMEQIPSLAKSLHNFNDKIKSKLPSIAPLTLRPQSMTDTVQDLPVNPASATPVSSIAPLTVTTMSSASVTPVSSIAPLTIKPINLGSAPTLTAPNKLNIQTIPNVSATKPVPESITVASPFNKVAVKPVPESITVASPFNKVAAKPVPESITVASPFNKVAAKPVPEEAVSEDVSSPILEDALKGFKSTVVEDDTIKLDIADFSGVSQYDLPKSITFGTLLVDMVTDGHDMTAHDLELLYEIFGNPELMASCIKNFKQADIYDVIDVVKNTFSHDQKMKLMINLADLVFRNGLPDEVELKNLNNLALEVNVILGELKKVLDLLKLKHDPDIFED